MKSKIISLLIAVTAVLSVTSCTVEYRTRHPRPVRQVIVVPVRVGFQSGSAGNTTIAFTPSWFGKTITR